MATTWDSILKDAKKETDDAFAEKVSSLTRLTDDEIKEVTPTSADKESLAKLMSVVADATMDNNAKAQAISNINGALQVVVPLLKKLL